MNLTQAEREIAEKIKRGQDPSVFGWRTANQVIGRLRRKGLIESGPAGHQLTPAGVEALSRENVPTLTRGQRRVLELARDGKRLGEGIGGMSAAGGLTATISSCRRRGWLTAGDEITAAGRAALEGT